MALDGVEEGAVVAVDVLADGDDGDAAVGDAQVGEDGSGQDEWLLARDVGDLGGVEEVPRFLGVGCEFCGMGSVKFKSGNKGWYYVNCKDEKGQY